MGEHATAVARPSCGITPYSGIRRRGCRPRKNQISQVADNQISKLCTTGLSDYVMASHARFIERQSVYLIQRCLPARLTPNYLTGFVHVLADGAIVFRQAEVKRENPSTSFELSVSHG